MLKPHHAVLGLAILFAPIADSLAQSQQPPDRNQGQSAQQPATTDQRGTDQSPFIVKVLPTEDTEAKAKQEAADRAAKDALDANTIRLGIAAITVAFLQFIAIGIQAIFLWRAVKVSERAAKSATKSADAVESQLRAYVSGKPEYMTVRDAVITIQYQTKNSGQTPAYRIRNASFIRKMPWPLPRDFVVESQNGMIPGRSPWLPEKGCSRMHPRLMKLCRKMSDITSSA